MPLQKGDVIRLETSGGGGHGDPKKRPRDALKTDRRTGICERESGRELTAPDV